MVVVARRRSGHSTSSTSRDNSGGICSNSSQSCLVVSISSTRRDNSGVIGCNSQSCLVASATIRASSLLIGSNSQSRFLHRVRLRFISLQLSPFVVVFWFFTALEKHRLALPRNEPAATDSRDSAKVVVRSSCSCGKGRGDLFPAFAFEALRFFEFFPFDTFDVQFDGVFNALTDFIRRQGVNFYTAVVVPCEILAPASAALYRKPE